MNCLNCMIRKVADDRDYCVECLQQKNTNKKIQEFASLFIKHDINFKILIFGSGEGKYFNFGNGITLNFYDAGRISFEYDEDCKEDIE